MTTMKAIGLHRYLPIEDVESLIDLHIEKPNPTGRDLLVKVQAISVNPVDVKVRSPKGKTEAAPRVLGWDVAGIVETVGPHVSLFKPGDEVYYAGSITRAGGNSEFHLVDERIAGHKPKTLDFAQAAALPLTAITAWEGLFDRLGISHNRDLNDGKSILIIGAAGGVGSIATQLASEAGLTVIGTASRPDSAQWARSFGAHHTINHHSAFLPQLQTLGFASVDYIFCLNQTEQHWSNMAEAIAPQGKICSIVEMSSPIDLTLLKNKSVTFVWELMFTRAMYETADMEEQHRLLNVIAERIDNGVLRTTIAKRLSPINAANLREAHQIVETGSMIGKIVLERFE
ncbi:zinc-binding alcohol dehydrogenase family protein [Paenibacillus endophyticus]|uniref:Zinc-type alcohol dehydrogenase-like protein n=1 Tax=Paenibacillus endophyticus TaxID=1294268 RepID=A0A7W5C8S1_9BACL|nr:zinc-binding alcohol dehydrogenase family protein [Paenibacillus endophyticus]MBB3152789.1 zinc-binding alcohol dehydrogenase family protein [Paenibacillus endophyticus]